MTKTTPRSPDWITLSQAATRLGVHPATLRRWADEGEVPALLTPGGHRRFRSTDIDRFAEQHAQNPSAGDQRASDNHAESANRVTCFGTNHRCAPTEFREQMMQLAIEFAQLNHASIGEHVVLATCNRTEIYAVSTESDEDAWLDEFAGQLTKRYHLTVRALNEQCYRLDELDAVHHLYRVSCGLDSMVVGEAEIAGQVARALADATARDTVGPVLSEVFQGAIRTGRRARSETAIGRGSASVSSVAVRLGRERLGHLDGRHVLVVGSGKMGRLAAVAFRGLAGAKLTIANRTRENAQQVVTGGERVIGLDGIAEALPSADLVITSTSAPGTVIDRPMVEQALTRRHSNDPIVFVDIAVPRDVEDSVRELPGVHLFGIDDLRHQIDANLAERQTEIPKVDRIIDEELDVLSARRSEWRVRPILSALRNKAEGIRQREVERFTSKHGVGAVVNPGDIDQLTHSIVNKILHDPTAQLRHLAQTRHREDYERLVRDLFALD